MIKLIKPYISFDEVENEFREIFESGWFTKGKFVEAFRQEIKSYTGAKHAYLTTSATTALTMALKALDIQAGDEVIVSDFSFPATANVVEDLGAIPIFADVSLETFNMLPEELEKKITPRTKAIIICNPNNPTGYLYTAAEMDQLKELVLKYNLFLFSDEAYREFCYEGKHISAMHLKGVEEQVILMDTISKRYSACGARIGALITKNKSVLEAVMKLAQARLSPPSFAQIAAEAAIDLPSDYFQETQEEYRSRRDLLVARLNAIPGVFCPNPGGAFYAIARLPINDSDQFCQWLLEDFAFEGKTIMLAPATGFYGTPGLGKDEVRLAYVLNKTDINTAMDCLEKALAIYPWKTSH
jgi:aspartate aminotransferase